MHSFRSFRRVATTAVLKPLLDIRCRSNEHFLLCWTSGGESALSRNLDDLSFTQDNSRDPHRVLINDTRARDHQKAVERPDALISRLFGGVAQDDRSSQGSATERDAEIGAKAQQMESDAKTQAQVHGEQEALREKDAEFLFQDEADATRQDRLNHAWMSIGLV